MFRGAKGTGRAKKILRKYVLWIIRSLHVTFAYLTNEGVEFFLDFGGSGECLQDYLVLKGFLSHEIE